MNKWLKLYVGLIVGSCYLITLLTFLSAYFNDMSICVTINDYGEANLELFLFGTSLVLILKWCYHLVATKRINRLSRDS